MKLQQLRYILEVYRHNLNVSEAANALFTSQPGVSKQIRLLEEELGIQIFIRSGKRVVSVSQPGKAVLELAERILRDVRNIKNIGNEFTEYDSGLLTVAAAHTQARSVLPETVAKFVKQYPKVRLNIKSGSSDTVVQMVLNGEADFAITTEYQNENGELRNIPYSTWTYAVIVPHKHPLLNCQPLQMIDLAAFPLITYESALKYNNSVARAFQKACLGLPDVVLSSADTHVLKTYVRLGLGVGLMNKAAFDIHADKDLCLMDATHLFEPSYTYITMLPDTYLRGYTYDFIKLLSPKLTRAQIDKILYNPIEEDFSI